GRFVKLVYVGSLGHRGRLLLRAGCHCAELPGNESTAIVASVMWKRCPACNPGRSGCPAAISSRERPSCLDYRETEYCNGGREAAPTEENDVSSKPATSASSAARPASPGGKSPSERRQCRAPG